MADSNQRLTDLQKTRRESIRDINSNASQTTSTRTRTYTSQLHKYCDAGSYDQIREIINVVDHSVFLERQGLHKWTPLMILCVRAPLDILKMIIQRAPESCHIIDTSKSLPLHFVACWRRDGEEEHVLKMLLSALRNDGKEQIEVTNQWGQNPLHAVFDCKEPPHRQLAVIKVLLGLDQISDGQDEDLTRLIRIADEDQSGIVSMKGTTLDDAASSLLPTDDMLSRKTVETKSVSELQHAGSESMSLPSEIISKLKKNASPGVLKSLSTPDSKSRLPLHIACKNGASFQVLQLLVALYPEACTVQTHLNQFPMHVYFDYLNTPLGKRKSALPKQKIQATMEMLINPILATYDDSRKRKKNRGLLPIHIACELGLSHEIIADLCKAYPKGVSKVKPGSTKYPLELFLLSKAHDNALSAKYQLDSLSREESESPEYEHLYDVLEGFHKTSDLLFAYFPEAVPSEKSGIKLFRRDLSRITRLEKLIRNEAIDEDLLELSPTARLVWIWMCHFTNPDNPRDVYVSSVGRVIDNLDSSALWKLTFIKNSATDQRTFLKVGGPSGKTVIMEAENRAARTTFYDLLHVSQSWQNNMFSYLTARDALMYSCANKHTYVTGVKYLSDIENLGEGRWESTSHPKPWKQLNLTVSSCTHSVELSYMLTEFKSSNEETQEQNEANSKWLPSGLKIFKGKKNSIFSNMKKPQADLLVTCQESRTRVSETESNVRLFFQCEVFQTYEVWYYLEDSISFISVQNVKMKELLYCRNSENRTPHFTFLSMQKMDESITSQDRLIQTKKSASLFKTAFPQFNMSPFHAISNSRKKNKSQKNLDSCVLHHSIKNYASIQVLQTIIDLNPKSLLEMDENGMTPMHFALVHLRNDITLEMIKSVLLITPGENACKYKDSLGRLPLHIAAENGAPIEILQALVDAYADGCYRQNKDGDLPLHLLERSGKANVSTLEMLIRPIMASESICRVEGSQGCDLPLHIAARYRCSYDILEKLLRTYSDAAGVSCKREEYMDTSVLYLFEEGKPLKASNDAKSKSVQKFYKSSDLIFVYNPMLSPSSKKKSDDNDIVDIESSVIPYRKDKKRVSRLANVIINEAILVADETMIGGKKKVDICDTARLAWAWMTTYENKEDDDDYYTTVEAILNNLSSPALKVLAFLEWNGKIIKDCALPKCKELIINRIRFVGRYEWSELEFPLHKSDTCLIMRAKDYCAVEEYTKLKTVLEDDAAAILEDGGDDLSMDQDTGIPLESFIKFCQILGLTEREAKQELRKYGKQAGYENSSDDSIRESAIFGLGRIQEANEEQQEDDEDAFLLEEERKINATTFENFCKSHGLDEKGVRRVVIKFMLYQQQFEREKATRDRIKLRGSDWPVVPILEDYNADRMEYSSKDALYAKDIKDKDESTHDMFRYKYALVLVGADRDLGEISVHESLSILQIREYMVHVGTSLQTLHRHSVIHGDLRLSNIVRFNSQLALIDLDSSYYRPSIKNGNNDMSYFGGSSHKFSSGMLPPEMLVKINPSTQQVLLDRYEFYWKTVYEDARDLDLLTPDDICNIASVVKSIAMTQGNFTLNNGNSDTAQDSTMDPESVHSQVTPSSSSGGIPNDITLGANQDWKHMISMALITISFSDLPYSLTSCNSITEFSNVWNKLLSNAELWELVRPRKSSDGSVYLVKAYHQAYTHIPNYNNTSQLPFNLVEATEKLDIWAFGVIIFALCANGHLFPLDRDDNLVGADTYCQLFNWDKKTSQKVIEERIHDPLAQDLLLQILVPYYDRLETMDMVLGHPFFAHSSGLEAQRILEKHEEQQLMHEETAVITQMTSDTLLRLENSTESQCKLIFEEEKIVVPTSLVVLPYELEIDDETGVLTAPDDPNTLDLAIEIGKHLLDINTTTARLSFWLMMKKKIAGRSADGFKKKMKNWLQRARSDSVDIVAKEIVNEIGSGDEYIHICREVLEKGDAISNARKYIKDPMSTASAAIHKSIESLVKCYSSHLQHLYLVDEYYGVPAAPDDVSRTNLYRDEENDEGAVYPIRLDPDTKHFQNLFLPFLNITVMTVTAIDGLESLSRLLGLSTSRGIPDSWIDSSDGLIHRASQPSSVAEFAVLQDLIRKQNFHSPNSGNMSLRSMESTRTGLSEWDETLVEVGSEMMQLEIFFREYDPLRIFSALRRVTGPEKTGFAIWTTEDVVRKILEEIEQAKVEMKLKYLKSEYYKSHGFMDEIIALNKQLHRIKSAPTEINNPVDIDITTVISATSTVNSQKRKKMRNTVAKKDATRNCKDYFLGRPKRVDEN